MTDNISPEIFADISDMSKKLESENSEKVTNMKASVNAYMMEWEDDPPPAQEGLKVTISPTARFATLGSYNLMTATDPIITVKKRSELADNLKNDKIEGFFKLLLKKSGEMEGTEIHLDAALSSLLFSEVHIGIDITSEVAKKMMEGASKAQKRQAEEVEQAIPIRLRVFNPTTGFYRRGPGGLSAYYRKEDITRGELRVSFPSLLAGNDGKLVTLNEWWDLEWHVVWITGEADPLVAVKHDLPFIPVIVSIASGSKLFSKPEHNSQPFLYTYVKSGLHARESLLLTVMFTKVFQYGLTPPLIIEGGTGNDTLTLNTAGALPFGTTAMGTKVSYPMANIIDPNVYNLYEIARSLGEQSTIFKQALGAPLEGGNNPFSSIALLATAGRLPLTGPQRATSKALAEALRIGLEIIKDQGLQSHESMKGIDVLDELDIDVKLDVKIPQDVFRNAQIGAQVTSGENAIVSKEWWWENAMSIQDTDGMRQKIMIEQSYAAAFGTDLMMEMEKRKALVAGNVPTGGEIPPGAGGEVPPQGEPMTAEGPMTEPIEPGAPAVPGTGQEEMA